MTTEPRFERQLPSFLEDLYLGPSPDYRDDVLAAATAKRQRPAWTFPGRWLPMADIADRPAFAPRLPWRTIGVALVLIALLVAAAVLYVGTRQTKVPAPFGPARNGQIVFAGGGDIFTGDPVSGASRAIVTGPEMDGNPLFSRDGTRVAFMRQVGDPSTPAFDLVVANADGSGPKVVATKLDTDNPYEWSPDGSYLVFTDTEFRLYRIDASGAIPPKMLIEHAYVQPGEFRPPDGRQILYEPQADGATGSQGGHALWVMNSDGSGAKPMVEIAPDRVRRRRLRQRQVLAGRDDDRIPAGTGRRYQPAPCLHHERRRERAPTAHDRDRLLGRDGSGLVTRQQTDRLRSVASQPVEFVGYPAHRGGLGRRRGGHAARADTGQRRRLVRLLAGWDVAHLDPRRRSSVSPTRRRSSSQRPSIRRLGRPGRSTGRSARPSPGSGSRPERSTRTIERPGPWDPGRSTPGAVGVLLMPARTESPITDAIPYRARHDGVPNPRRPWTSEDASSERGEAIMTPSRSSSAGPSRGWTGPPASSSGIRSWPATRSRRH